MGGGEPVLRKCAANYNLAARDLVRRSGGKLIDGETK